MVDHSSVQKYEAGDLKKNALETKTLFHRDEISRSLDQ